MAITKQAIARYLESCRKIIFDEFLRTLTFLGEQSVATARGRAQEDSWYDQTGNLRSSIGFAVFSEGQQIMQSAFEAVAGPQGGGTEGSRAGKQYADTFAGKYQDTLALVVIAGMSYASYVEAKDNKDVLATAELQAKAKMEEYLQRALNRALDKINKLKIA